MSSTPQPSFRVTVLFIVICFAIAAVWNNHVYGDWTCLFSNCVRVKP